MFNSMLHIAFRQVSHMTATERRHEGKSEVKKDGLNCGRNLGKLEKIALDPFCLPE
jgi:hypothetical protein